VISLDARPRLAPKVRLRVDRVSGQTLLLYPEKGLALNPTAAEICGLCTGELAVREMIETLAARHGANDALAGEVQAFLQDLAERNLLRGLEP
jgi:coenzyme PQQ biosynthesis protein PqqD